MKCLKRDAFCGFCGKPMNWDQDRECSWDRLLYRTNDDYAANHLMKNGWKLFNTETVISSRPRSFGGYDGEATTGQITDSNIVFILVKDSSSASSCEGCSKYGEGRCIAHPTSNSRQASKESNKCKNCGYIYYTPKAAKDCAKFDSNSKESKP